ncbi:BNR-4 repeat-containing protein [uncultured Kriegella sp.]|uniref:BNR-4 repeat-containing protein n=1 Tax=uncultured Kriegella sp. TaxID=1798910 RepID=UPI0030DC89EF|tara:strand:+ start:52473 stop:53924 length:1452 start_codon:yes stop_codon:yes gene_type:complete
MKKNRLLAIILITVMGQICLAQTVHPDAQYGEGELLNIKANGFRGIWYMNQPSNDEYVYKYSGGMATYTAKHRPFGIYSEKVNKTFFCFGGTDKTNSTLFHNVSYFDHTTGKVANPTSILDKHTADAHDNPVISLDDAGYIYIFSTSHGTGRPSYVSKSVNPYDITEFRILDATEIANGKKVPFDNFSYFQVWYVKGKGFMAMFTKYDGWSNRIIGFNTSKDGENWNEWKVIAHIDMGHYQVSGVHEGKIAVAFNYHPEGKGLNYRTNLYYLETNDFGKTWTSVDGQKVELPLTTVENPALVKDFKSEGLNCYMKDLKFDKLGNPVILVVSSKGYESGPKNNPRTWEVFSYNKKWNNSKVITSDNNYDTGSIYIEKDNWRIIAPTDQGPQHFNPGGEIAMWTSDDMGISWRKIKQITTGSEQNNNYVRSIVNGQDDFYGIWADGHGRKPSESTIYFCDKGGNAYLLPKETTEEMVLPLKSSQK